jgi:Flp pilus assembly protein protease CpaA
MWLPLLFVALPISLADIKTLTIPNVYLWWLSLTCAPYLLLHGLGPIARLVGVILILAALSFLGLGMGDVKLIVIICLLLNSDKAADFSLLAFLILLSASSYAIVKALWNRSFPHTIPLAPSIFTGVALYLASS